ncbi:hypothetical protein RclHR1_02690008 [Rhizophagus clarus]|uniref:Fungal-specific transcription factor domain-domain-containing protein n=1 Tax=Rhizophagus clarus TaxID=94130 RepID=A0A2Z6R160_9GLOM|nr:hypothetical protein RclHR1_02690008 [Rhizophagus clarus]GES95004.1 fungal-specific transcription factor domain-domain-containing protein [Rhizophagus clarus]
MTTTYLRPLTNPKRVKLVSTCDVCKNRKVKCDKERPECGTCKKTNRKCSYTYAAFTESIREKQSGGFRSQSDSNFLQTQLNYLQNIQFGQLYEESGYLSMASRGFGEINDNNITGMLAMPTTSMATNVNDYNGFDATSLITSEVLQNSSNVASSIQRNNEQCQYDPTYFSNYVDYSTFTQEQQPNLYQSQSDELMQQQNQQNQQYQQSQQNQQVQYTDQEMTFGDTIMDELASDVENLKLYESTRYIGEGSLLMLEGGNDGELIIPQMQPDLSQVDDYLKILPNKDIIEELISLYFKHVHRYFPALKQQTVWNAVRDINKPQHLLLLNCIFFTASPFHEDPNKRDGRIYFLRAEALLYEYCTQPHALTVMSIIILGRHNKQIGASWMYSGIATKMLFELGLHRKIKNLKIKINKEVEQSRNEAFWMCFISENFVSATYGRPNMIDETDCDVDVPDMPSDSYPIDEKTRLEIAYIHLINLSRICARVRKYMHAASKQRFLMQEDENKFRVLDAALASWFHSLPEWLRFNEINKDSNGVLLNGIGGDLYIFYYAILILLHGRYLNSPEECEINASNSHTICIQSATIIVHCLEILLEKHPDFFAFAVYGPFAINPAKRVFSWQAKYHENKKAEDMLRQLELLKNKIAIVSKSYDRGRVDGEEILTEWLGIPTQPRNRVNDEIINPREWEVFIADDDRNLRRQYSLIARKQSGGPFMPRKKTSSYSRSMSMSSNSSIYMKGVRLSSGYDYNMNSSQNVDEFNFIFKTDKSFDFSAFSQSSDQNYSLPRVTLDGVLVEEPEQFGQDHKQFGGGSQYHTPLQQSPQLQPQQFNSPYHSPHQQSPQLHATEFYTPLNLSPQLNPQDYSSPYQQSPQLRPEDYSNSSQLNQFGSQYNSPQLLPQQYHSPQVQDQHNSPLQQSPLLSHEELDLKHTVMISPQQFYDQIDNKNILNSGNDNINLAWTSPQSEWSQSNNDLDNIDSSLLNSGVNTLLTPPSDFLSETSLEDITDDGLWHVLHNENHLGNSPLIDGSGLSDGLNGNENEDGLGISIENK